MCILIVIPISVIFTVPTVTIVSTPAGTPVSGFTNTFDYPILSSVTLICRATASDGSTPTVSNFQWDTTGCYTNPAHNSGNPTCFPTGQTNQSVIGNDLTAEDAGTITCTAVIGDSNYTSEPLTLGISGKCIIGIITDHNAFFKMNKTCLFFMSVLDVKYVLVSSIFSLVGVHANYSYL